MMAHKSSIFLLIDHDSTCRDFLKLGILRHLLELCPSPIVLLTPAFREKQFLEEALIDERVTVQPLPIVRETRLYHYWRKLRKRIGASPFLKTREWRIERRLLNCNGFTASLRRQPMGAMILTHPLLFSNRVAEIAARALGIRTVGLLASWDHVSKGLLAHPELLGVWNGIDQQGVIDKEGYSLAATRVVGPTGFDPYFWPSTLKPREEFLSSLGLDPGKKTIMLATGGPIFGLAQASWLEDLLEAQRKGKFEVPVQLVCRTHPYDNMLQFMQYVRSSEVLLDYHTRFSPVSGWQSDLDEIRHKANLLAWSDVILTPASTFTLEAAIFNTPTVVLAYNNANPDLVLGVLEKGTFSKHFKRLVERKLVPVSRSAEETVQWCNTFLRNREAYGPQRKEIVRDWVVFTDGNSARRSAEFISDSVSCCSGARP